MPSDSGRTTSVWMATSTPPQFTALTENTSTDVCIVGAGVAGLTTAYLLAREGKSVVVLDDGAIGGGESGRTTAHLTCILDQRYDDLERSCGKPGAKLAAESHSQAIDRIETIVRDERIDCDFERLDGYLFVPPGEPTDVLDRELAATHRAGLQTELVARAPIGGFHTGPCLRIARQAQFHPLKYLNGLAAAITSLGGRIYIGSPVDKISGGEVHLRSNHVVTPGAVVVATNVPFNDRITIHTKQVPCRTYVVGARVPVGTVFSALYWDTASPYHYVRLQRVRAVDGSVDHDVLIVGGEDHKTGQAENPNERFQRLEAWARERFPMIEGFEFRWSGQVVEPVDGLAFIGRNPHDDKNVFITTGASGNGMTYGAVAAMLLTDLIDGRPNPWETLYDPSRTPIRAAVGYVQANLNILKQYANWARGGDVSSVDEIPPGGGAVLQEGLQKVAVHRSADGSLHRLSAVCPHLGCVVRWNSAESTWDCPCHGSRFSPSGRVVNGPSAGPLACLDEHNQPVEEAVGAGKSGASG